MLQLNPTLAELLLRAYAPCPAFGQACRSMRWDPSHGHVPRGFCGAAGELHEVELVLVGAEPGDPHASESHAGRDARAQLQSAYDYAYECFRSGTDLYHRNMRLVLHLCWPKAPFEEQMRKVWITDSVLCSAPVEGGKVRAEVEGECRRRYLEAQLALFPTATVAALGRKAQQRLKQVAQRGAVIPAYSVAPPGCNMHKEAALQSWERISRAVRQRARSLPEAPELGQPATPDGGERYDQRLLELDFQRAVDHLGWEVIPQSKELDKEWEEELKRQEREAHAEARRKEPEARAEPRQQERAQRPQHGNDWAGIKEAAAAKILYDSVAGLLRAFFGFGFRR